MHTTTLPYLLSMFGQVHGVALVLCWVFIGAGIAVDIYVISPAGKSFRNPPPPLFMPSAVHDDIDRFEDDDL